MGETRVDLQHLLEDLRDAYTGALEETILTEVVANALDSGATRVRLLTNPADATLTIVDDGRGMQRRELARYHDVAASTKRRGEGIGFAGVGIKLGLLVSREVVTETRRGSTHVATRWHLASRHRAPWKWIPPPGLTASRGTAVRLTLTSQLSPLLDAGYLDETIRRQFEPLLDPTFDELLRRHYPNAVAFEVDGRELTRGAVPGSERIPISIRLGRRRTPSVSGFIERNPRLAAGREGVAISTFGKVIKRGWDWLGLAPTARALISGLIEAPDLAECLTLSKNDFIRVGARGASYLAYRKAIQEVVSRQLAEWGDGRDTEARPRLTRLGRDLERVLEDLADDFPLLRSLVDRRAGGQKRLPMPGRGDVRVPAPLFADASPGPDAAAEGRASWPAGGDTGKSPVEPASPQPEPPPPSPEEMPQSGDRSAPEDAALATKDGRPRAHIAATGTSDTVSGRRRPARYGLLVRFESRPADSELGRLVDSTVWINDAHPAYTRAVASRSLGYHTALAVALALAPLAVEADEEHTFITQFLAHWGSAQAGSRVTGRRRTTNTG
ncbi:MAG: ATP-binding protein [Gemmatimonadetes bacterium]|nr:ATP-binding protein [Gemmatimonadota bacterium]